MVQLIPGGKLVNEAMYEDAGMFVYAPNNEFNGLLPVFNDFVLFLIKSKLARLDSDELAFDKFNLKFD